MPENLKSNNNQPAGRFRFRTLFYLTFTLLIILALWSYSPQDTAAIEGGNQLPLANWVGGLGAWMSSVFFHLIGLASWVLAAALLLVTLRGFLPGHPRRRGAFWGVLALTVGAMFLFALSPGAFVGETSRLGLGSVNAPESALSGGVIGQVLVAPACPATPTEPALPAGVLRHFLGAVGAALVGWVLLTFGAILIYMADWRGMISWSQADAAAGSLLDKVDSILNRAEAAAPPAPTPACAEAAKTPSPPLSLAGASAAAAPEAPAASGGLLRNALSLLKSKNTGAAATPEAPGETEVPAAAPETPVEAAPVAVMPPEAPAPAVAPVAAPVAVPTPAPPRVEPIRTVPPAIRAAGVDPDGYLKPETPAPNGQSVRPDAVKKSCDDYVLPLVSMLTKGEEGCGEDPQVIAQSKERLQSTLEDFGVNGNVCGHLTGPQVTRYEISLAPGVRVDKVSSLSDNILMNLQVPSIRILAPIPGRNVVGVEVPNTKRETITLRSVFESEVWRGHKGEIPVVLGKNVSGKPVVTDLAKAPHLLIAGATGSGKSVCVNSLIMSLMFKFKPDELRLILVDPKVVEFIFYQTLPYLITPVINESNKALLALRWAVNEMEKRYRMLAKVKTRNIKEYNTRGIANTGSIDEAGQPLPEKLPLLIIIVDEFADLMMGDRTIRKDVETAIARIAQKGRAAGVHIVLATQRPSTNVLTGVIKANLPTKIALRVGSQIDSRVIVDRNGAESLLGYGDMLFLPPSSPELERIQGTWVSNEEIEKVVDFISEQAQPQFNDNVVADPESEDEDEEGEVPRGKGRRKAASDDFDDDADIADAPNYSPIVEKYLQPDDDDLVKQALEIILTEHQASTSYLQRRLRLGYNRAADLIDEFERRGIIGPARDGGNKREILVFDELTGE